MPSGVVAAAPVTISVMSPHQATSGAGAVNTRLTRSGAAGRLPGRVRPRRRRWTRPARPSSAIARAIVLLETCQPCSRSSMPMRGLP
jgi:hypothetical protein